MNSNFKFLSRFTLCLLVLFSGLGINKALASHYAAGDLYVDYIGSGPTNLKYKVTLVVYKACELGSIDLGPTEGYTVFSADSGYSISRSLTRVGYTTPGMGLDTLDQLCGNFSPINSCRVPGSVWPGFIQEIFNDTVTVPIHARDTKWFWTAGSRNSGIQNLCTAGGTNIYVECEVNNLDRYNTSSPRYSILPLPYLCQNEPNLFINGPIDPDVNVYDSTINLQPLGSAGVVLPYCGGTPAFTLANPIEAMSPPGYVINTSTGTSSFTPTQPGKFVLAFRTYKMDKYLLNDSGRPLMLGYVSRDVQVTVLTCPGVPPAIDSTPVSIVNGQLQPGDVVNVCPGKTMTFQVHTTSTNPLAQVKLLANNSSSATGSTFTDVISPGSTVATFTWTPTITDIGQHVIVINARDSTCNNGQPIILNNYLIVTISVLPGLDAGADGKVCPLGDHAFQLQVSGPASSIYNWTGLDGNPAQYLSCTQCPNPLATPPVTTTYVVTSPDPLFVCKNSDTVVVAVDNTNSITIDGPKPLIVCRPGYTNLTSHSNGPAPVSNIPCGTANPQTCATPDSAIIGGGNAAASNVANTPFYSDFVYHHYQFVIPRAELLNSGLYSGTLQSISFLSIVNNALGGTPLPNFNISLKCSNRTGYPATPGNGDFETGTTLVASVPSFTIVPGGWNKINFTTPYSWDTTQNLIVDICMGALNPANANGIDPVAMVPGASIQRYDNVTDACANFVAIVNGYTQRPVVKFGNCTAPSLPFVYYWKPGLYLNDSNAQNVTAYVPNNETFYVYTHGRNNCLVRDSVPIIVPVHHVFVYPLDTSICYGESVKLHARGAGAGGSGGYQWFENDLNTPATSLDDPTSADPLAHPLTTTTYYTIFNDQYDGGVDCMDTTQLVVNVLPLPNVQIANSDTVITFGQVVNLMATGAYKYSWTPSGSLSDPNIPNPIANPTQSTSYVVFGIDRNGCQNTDTVLVNVNQRNGLMVPSAFTPNNDGVNDQFKVVGLTFEKVMEFRVFNRWGQEIFSTTDGKTGWDGRWKSVPQEMGTYSYLIRIGFPDGYVETFKGEVTLIR